MAVPAREDAFVTLLLTTEDIEGGLDAVRCSPKDGGTLELIVRRPATDEREVLDVATLDVAEGLVGDTWRMRPSSRTADGTAHPDMQINVINARFLALICPDETRRPLAGDQLHVDLDISYDNLPFGTQLAIGDAVIEVTEQPHTGCAKFSSRFGADALRFVNSPMGRSLNLRGINARVVTGGTIRQGETIRVLRG